MSVGVHIPSIRDALAATLETVAASAGCEVLAYVESPRFPAIGVFPSQGRDYVDPNLAFEHDGQVELAFDLRTAMPFGAEESARLLDELMSPGDSELSLYAVLNADPTLGGAVDGLRFLPIPPFNDLGEGLMEAVLPIVVMATRLAP